MKKIGKSKRAAAFLFLLSIIITGCASKENQTPPETTQQTEATASGDDKEKQEASHIKKTMESYAIPKREEGSMEAEVAEYNLGSGEYKAQSGKIMPYKLRGIIGAPKGDGPFPVIFITHGSHSNEDESKRFDTGFTYLVESLAKNGFIAVSVDMGSAYIWKYGDSDEKEKSIFLANEHRNLLEAANENQNGWPIDLTGKVDLKSIGWAGHSRGGDIIFDIANDWEEKGIPVKGLLSIAPAASAELETQKWPKAKASILVPQYDGDVISLDGFNIQTMLAEAKNDTAMVTMLMKANHNYFNSAITQNDALLNRSQELLTDQLSAEEQQTYLVNFAVDFFGYSLKNQSEGTLYEKGAPSPDTMYGFPVMSRSASIPSEVIAQAGDWEHYDANGCTAKLVSDSWFFEKDEVAIDTITFGEGEHQIRKLLEIQWTQPGSSFTIIPDEKDFSLFSSLDLQIVPDPASDLNKGDYFSASLVVKDTSGNSCTITLPKESPALSKTPGMLDMTPLYDKELYFWSSPSPVCSIRIPLSKLEEIDLKQVESVELLFDQTDSGSLFFESIQLN